LTSFSGNPFVDHSVSGNPFVNDPPPPPKASLSQVQGVHIRNHVLEVLDFETGNFTSWQTFFHITFRMYGLQEHINGSLAMPLFIPDVEWSQIDQCIVSWLYTSVSKAIRDIILQPADTAARAWSAIVALFLNNRLQRAIDVKDEFHTFSKATSPSPLSPARSSASPTLSVTSARRSLTMTCSSPFSTASVTVSASSSPP
jgi:hypothetical protein